MNPVTNKIYVANRGSNSVTVIDGATNATTTLAVGLTPVFMALNEVTNKIYVLTDYGGVTVIDGATNATTTVAAGQGPDAAVAVNPVTNKIYVANDEQLQRDGDRRSYQHHHHRNSGLNRHFSGGESGDEQDLRRQ